MIALLALVSPSGGFWPGTGAGWVTLILALLALVLVPIGYGKWIEKMNGIGRRMKAVEEEHKTLLGKDVERRLEIDRILGEHRELILRVGESKLSADHCLEEAERHAIDIGASVAGLGTSFNSLALTMSERLTAVETELRLSRGVK